MPKRLNQNQLLLILLIGGGVFVIIALCIVGALLQRPPANEAGEIAAQIPAEAIKPTTTPTPIEMDAGPEITLQPPPTSKPTTIPTAAPSNTPTSAPVSGDRLTLPTKTPTVTPTRTPAPTSTPRPATSVPGSSEGLRVGNIAPDFTLGSNRASRVSLSDLRGKIVILNFWASWCAPCRHEVPALQAIHQEYGPQGVVVLAVNVKEKLENVERFAWDNGISFAVWLDEDGWASHNYQVRSIPTTYFIDQDGIIRAVNFGAMSREQIVTHLEKLL